MPSSQQDYRLNQIIYAKPEAIFGTLTDFASLQRFVPNIIRAHRPEPAGPFAVGMHWEERRNLLFLRDSLHLEVTDVQPLSRVQWVLRDGIAAFTYTFSLLPTIGASGGATNVICDVMCTACYGGAAAARLACFMQQKDAVLLQRLKQLLETDNAAESRKHPAAGPIAVC